jgi:phage major head subunit gpT-like protein
MASDIFASLWVPSLQGAFLTSYEGEVQKGWSAAISSIYDVNTKVSQYDDIGTVGAVSEVKGNPVTTDPVPYNIQVTNKVFKLGFEVDVEDVKRDRLGVFEAKATEIGQKMALYRDKLVGGNVTNNDKSTDNVALFSSSHYGSQSNDISNSQVASLDVVAPTAPTAVEASLFMGGMLNYLFTLVDESLDPINGGARDFMFAASNIQTVAAINNAIFQLQLTQGQTNPIKGYQAKGYSFDCVYSPYLGTATDTKVYLFRKDSSIKPFLVQEEGGVEMQYLGVGSDRYVDRNKYFFGAKWVGNTSPQRWQHALRATLS